MKKLFTLYAILLQLSLFAQHNTSTTGATATGTNGNATYTVGQMAYLTNSAANASVSQGVQHPFEIVTLGTNEIPQIQLTAIVYPNPTVQNVALVIKDFDLTNLNYQLFDIQGRIISNGKITQNETQIEMTLLASAQYILKVSNNKTVLKTFKIIKNNSL